MVGQILGAVGNIASSYIQNQWSRDAAEESYDRQIRFWKMQNEYNTPKNQVNRLLAAGLNPNLMYGSGSASTGNASGSVSAPMPNLERFRLDNLSNIDSLILQRKQVEADVKNKDTLADYNQAKTATEILNALGKEIENAKASEDYSRMVRLRESYDSLLKYNVDNLAADLQNKQNQDILFGLTLDAQVKQAIGNSELTQLQKNVAVQTAERLKAAARLDNAKVVEVSKNVALLSEKIAQAKRENKFGDAIYEKSLQRYSQELINLMISGDRAKLENYLKGKGLDSEGWKQARGLYNSLSNSNDLPKAQNYYDYGF